MGKVKALKWVKRIAEPQYYWTAKTGWTEKEGRSLPRVGRIKNQLMLQQKLKKQMCQQIQNYMQE